MFHLEGITSQSFRSTRIINPDNPSEELRFDGRGFSGASFRARNEDGEICTFIEMNDYIKNHLTKEERTNLYLIYVDIDSYFDSGQQNRRRGASAVDMFDMGLSKRLNKLFNLVKFKGVKDYVLDKYKKGEIRIPADVHVDYQIEDKMQQKHIDCTYLREDYLDLVAMSMYMRLMIPIWGRYLPITKFDSRYALKEYHALKLIEGTVLFKEYTFSRLDTYVRGTVSIEDDLAVMASGLSNEEIPFFLMSQIVVKRLPIFSISYPRTEDRNSHLMSMMFHLIGGSGASGKLGQMLKKNIYEKKPIKTEWSDEDNSSVWDMYKNRELIAGGDLAITEVYITDHCFGDDPELTKLCHEYIKDINIQKITPAQIQLMTWIMATMIPGNVIPLFEGEVFRKALAIAQSQLYTWGFKELAILLTAEAVPLEEDMVIGSFSQKPVSNEKRLELDKVYGLHHNLGNNRVDNVGIESIKELTRKFLEFDWGVNCDKELYKDNEDLLISPIFGVPGDIRNNLADLLIKISQLG